MDRDCKRKKTKKIEICGERSPLQHLNGLPVHKRNSDLSSSSAPAASRFLISDNPCSSSSFYSYSRTHLDKKPKTLSRLGKNGAIRSSAGPRPKENEVPRKPFMQASRKDKSHFIMQKQDRSSNAKPASKIRQRSKLSSVQGKSDDMMKKGSQGFQEKAKTSLEKDSGKCTIDLNSASNGNNSNGVENCSPLCERVTSGYGSHTPDSVYERPNSDANTATDVKTPPVEPSVSPEIQCQSQSRMVVLKSVGTPVCYGAGHLLSGVSDKRKSRRRGSLKGGPEKAILFLDARRDENVTVDLKESSIPLLAEASVRWHLSPSDMGRDDGNKLEQVRMTSDDGGSGILDLLSSPSMLCGNSLDFLCDKSNYCGSLGSVAVNRSSSNVISSKLPGILETLSCDMDVPSPNATYSSKGLSRGSSIFSGGSWSSGNIIQTPDSDSSSDACFRRSSSEVHLSNSAWHELIPLTKPLERMKLSPKSEMSMWDAPGLVSSSVDMGSPPISLYPIQFQRNGDIVSSWVSDTTTSDNLTLSQMRISWCDALASKNAGTDEFDCCCCLSDGEIEGDESAKFYPLTEVAEEKETYKGSYSGQRNYMVDASVENKDGLGIGNEFSPVLLDYEPCIPAEGKGKCSPPDACAESISTDGGGLIASNDSEWTYFQENSCFISHKEA